MIKSGLPFSVVNLNISVNKREKKRRKFSLFYEEVYVLSTFHFLVQDVKDSLSVYIHVRFSYLYLS